METAPHKFAFYDDDCNLFTPEMYEAFRLSDLEGSICALRTESGRQPLSAFRLRHGSSASHSGQTEPDGLQLWAYRKSRRHPPLYAQHPYRRPAGSVYVLCATTKTTSSPKSSATCEAIRSTGTRGLNLSTAGSINNGFPALQHACGYVRHPAVRPLLIFTKQNGPLPFCKGGGPFILKD